MTCPLFLPVSSALEVFQFLFYSVTFGVLPSNDFTCAGLPTHKLKWKCVFSNYASSPSYILARVATQNVKLSLHNSQSVCNNKVSQSHFLNHVKDSQDSDQYSMQLYTIKGKTFKHPSMVFPFKSDYSEIKLQPLKVQKNYKYKP